MSRTDFCRLSPEQFYWISKAHRDEQERLSRERWEIMRMEAAIMIQPHVKNRITPKSLLPFPGRKGRDTLRRSRWKKENAEPRKLCENGADPATGFICRILPLFRRFQ